MSSGAATSAAESSSPSAAEAPAAAGGKEEEAGLRAGSKTAVEVKGREHVEAVGFSPGSETVEADGNAECVSVVRSTSAGLKRPLNEAMDGENGVCQKRAALGAGGEPSAVSIPDQGAIGVSSVVSDATSAPENASSSTEAIR